MSSDLIQDPGRVRDLSAAMARGELTAEEELAEGEFVKAQLARIGAPHWQEFLAAWG